MTTPITQPTTDEVAREIVEHMKLATKDSEGCSDCDLIAIISERMNQYSITHSAKLREDNEGLRKQIVELTGFGKDPQQNLNEKAE